MRSTSSKKAHIVVRAVILDVFKERAQFTVNVRNWVRICGRRSVESAVRRPGVGVSISVAQICEPH